VAKANAQILQGLRNITSQLDRDLKGICLQGQVYTVCLTESRSDPKSPQGRFDRLVFVTSGDFESYKTYRPAGADAGQARTVRGNTALVSYMLARRPGGSGGTTVAAAQLPASRRILARTQHILTPETFEGTIDPNIAGRDPQAWFTWHNRQEYDNFTVVQWSQMKGPAKANALAMLTDYDVGEASLKAGERGACVDPGDPNSIQMLLCDGVADFSVQGWDESDPNHWVPAADAQGKLSPSTYSGLPGDGRALKFTFTLVDPKGILKQGRTFTHIVYLKD
jgi:hypothetical protein